MSVLRALGGEGNTTNILKLKKKNKAAEYYSSLNLRAFFFSLFQPWRSDFRFMVMMSEWSVWGKVTVCSVGVVIFSPPCPAPAGPWTPDPRIWASNPPAWRAYSGPDESAGALATDWTVYSSSYVAVEDHLLFIVSDLCVSKPPVTHAHTVSDKLNWRLQTHTAGRWSVLVSLMTSCLGVVRWPCFQHTHTLF